MGYKDPIANIEKIRKSRREWYSRNKETEIVRIVNRRREIATWFREFKETFKCSQCPEDDPVCLVFHHRDPSEKDIAVSQAIGRGWSIDRIKMEIAKCDILCANCHAKQHRRDPKVWETASKAV